MARKRGGLAGIWDRNKKIIKPVASAAGSLFGVPPAASMALMEGLDRKGKRGIGFDVGQAAKGAVKGYVGGKVAGGLLNYGGGQNGMESLKLMFRSGHGLGDIAKNIGHNVAQGGNRVMQAAQGVGNWAKNNPLAAGTALNAGANYLSSAQNRAMDQQRFDFDREMVNRSWQERQRLMELLRPLFIQMTSRMGAGA